MLIHEVLQGITHGTSLDMTETQVQVLANSLRNLVLVNIYGKKQEENMIHNFDAIIKKQKHYVMTRI